MTTPDPRLPDVLPELTPDLPAPDPELSAPATTVHATQARATDSSEAGAAPARAEKPVDTARPSLWHHADFMRLWAGDTASQLGAALGTFAIPYLAVTALNASEFQMGLLGTLTTLGFLIIGLPSGALIDRRDKRSVMITADFGRFLLLATLPVAWWLEVLTFAQVAIVATLVGMLQVFFDVSYQSYLPSLVHRDQVVEGNSKLQASQSVSQAVGPAFGGFLIKIAGAAWSIAINAIGYLISAVCLLKINHRETPPARTDRRPLASEIREGLAFVVRHPLLRRLIACTGISNLFNSVSNVLMVLYMVQMLHLSPVTIGVIEAAMAVGGLCGALITTRLADRIGEGPTIIVTATPFAVIAFAWPLSSVLPAVPTLLVASFVTGVSVVAYNIATVSFRQRLCPPKLLGRMNASARFLVWGGMPIGSFIGGVLGHQFGVLPTFYVAAVGVSLSLLPIYLSPLWRIRKLPAYDEDGEGAGGSGGSAERASVGD